ncbi:unnamed protein product, partial [Polarella glacialis]
FCLRGSALLLLAALPTVVHGSTLAAIVNMPAVDPDRPGQFLPIGAPQIAPLSREGQTDDTAAKNQSQFLWIGCFVAPMSITKDAEQDTNFDPNACVEVCKERMPNTPPSRLIVAVHGPRCGCADGLIGTFSEADPSQCYLPCKFYQNPICGGLPSQWGVFVQYDALSFASNGAY